PRPVGSLDGRLRHAADRDEAPRALLELLRDELVLRRAVRRRGTGDGAGGRDRDRRARQGGANLRARAAHASGRVVAESAEAAALFRLPARERQGRRARAREMERERPARHDRPVHPEPEAVRRDRARYRPAGWSARAESPALGGARSVRHRALVRDLRGRPYESGRRALRTARAAVLLARARLRVTRVTGSGSAHEPLPPRYAAHRAAYRPISRALVRGLSSSGRARGRAR